MPQTFVKIATAITLDTSKTATKPFQVKTLNGTRCFTTFEEALYSRCVDLVVRSVRKKTYNALPQEEKRKLHVERNGNSDKLERKVAFEMKAMSESLGFELLILNDGTRADLLLERPDGLCLPIQLKTTSNHVSGNENCWHFREVLGYTGMPVVCWRDDKKSGWIFDGDDLQKRGKEVLGVTPGRSVEELAMHEGHGAMGDIILFLVDLLVENPDKFPGVTRVAASWDFAGKALKKFKERVALEIWKTTVDKAATFPDEQNGSFDLVSKGERLQFKPANRMKGQAGLLVRFNKSAGRVDGKPTYRPYSAGSFDAVVVMLLDWKTNKAHIWKIDEKFLIEKKLLKTEECEGSQSFYVYFPDTPRAKFGPRADIWTYEHYMGTKDMPESFGEEAETVAARFFAECRA